MKIIRCKKCLKPCTVGVSLKGTESMCCHASVFTQEEFLGPKNEYLKPWWRRKIIERAAGKEIEK